MSFQELSQHSKIGLDVDLTLIDGRCSRKLCTWVENFHSSKELWIITFRDAEDMAKLWKDLENGGYKPEWFQGVKSIPEELHSSYMKFKKVITLLKTSNQKKLDRILAAQGATRQEVLDVQQRVLMWKATACHELGLTALVDDLPAMVEEGCKHHGITFVDANLLSPLTSGYLKGTRF